MVHSDYIYLLKIFRHRFLKITEIREILQMTSGQLDYRYRKINEWLTLQGVPSILRENGYFVIHDETAKFIEGLDVEDLEFTHYEEQLRIVLLALYLVFMEGNISIFHITEFLKVSKNTLLSDLEILRKFSEPFDVDLAYNRDIGYHFKGDEWSVRRLLEELLSLTKHPDFIVKAMSQEIESFEDTHRWYRRAIENMEIDLSYYFSDEAFAIMPIYLYLVNVRIQKGHRLKQAVLYFEELKESKEYHYIEANETMFFTQDSNDYERVFLSLYLNAQKKVHYGYEELGHFKEGLRNSILSFIEEFIKISAVKIEDKNTLVDKLLVHIAPLTYRHLSHAPYADAGDFINNTMKEDLKETKYFVEKSIYPLEDYLNRELPESEIYFISMYLQSHLKMTQDAKPMIAGSQALVVCESGIATSQILKNKLQNLFPNIYFDEPISIRNYLALENTLDYDLVFSTSYFIPEDKNKLIVVQDFEHFDEAKVRREVTKLLGDEAKSQHLSIFHENLFFDLESIVGAELNQKQKREVLLSLHRNVALKKEQAIEKVSLEELSLLDFIREDNLLFIEEDLSWEEMIEVLSAPYLKREVSSELLQLFPKPEARILFGSEILLPHMHVDFIQNFEFRFMYLKKALNVEGMPVHFVALLLASDNHSHLSSLYELHDLSLTMHQQKVPLDFKDKADVVNFLQDLV